MTFDMQALAGKQEPAVVCFNNPTTQLQPQEVYSTPWVETTRRIPADSTDGEQVQQTVLRGSLILVAVGDPAAHGLAYQLDVEFDHYDASLAGLGNPFKIQLVGSATGDNVYNTRVYWPKFRVLLTNTDISSAGEFPLFVILLPN